MTALGGSNAFLGSTEKPQVHRQEATRAMHSGEKEPGEEGKVIDEKAELRLIAAPAGWPVEGKTEEQHIGGREKRGFRKIRAGQKAENKGAFEERRQPSQ